MMNNSTSGSLRETTKTIIAFTAHFLYDPSTHEPFVANALWL